MPTSFTLFHNPKCSTSRAALDATKESDAQVDVVQYLKAPLEEQALRDLIAVLEDPATDLVRRDKKFAELGLTDADVATVDHQLHDAHRPRRRQRRQPVARRYQRGPGSGIDRLDAAVARRF